MTDVPFPRSTPIGSAAANTAATAAAAPGWTALATVFDRIDAMVIGASAGGVEALTRILPAFPAGFAPTVIIVLHLPPDASSELAALFAPRCKLSVRELSDREPLVGGTIYFAPAGYHSLVNTDRRCALSIEEPVNFSRPSIDVLFESAAWTYGARLLAVLLTGASSDGAYGMAVVHAEGGQNWAQDPQEARSSTMPLSAIERGVVDHVVRIDDIIGALSASASVLASKRASSVLLSPTSPPATALMPHAASNVLAGPSALSGSESTSGAAPSSKASS